MKTRKMASNVDARLKQELEVMMKAGYALAPISRPALQKRLGLSSRGILAIDHRARLIEEARKTQLAQAGLDADGKKTRNGPAEQNKLLMDRVSALERERDTLVEKLALIINGCQARGYNADEIMLPIRNYPSSR